MDAYQQANERMRQIEDEMRESEPAIPCKPSLGEWYPSRQRLYQENMRAWREVHRRWEAELLARVEAGVAEVYGLVDHPKRKRLWELAWDMGHPNGLHGVLSQYDTLSELLR